MTILFADVKGSTSIAEQLDPEEWTEIMNGAFERLIPIIDRFGGLVIRLLGDAVLALFGAPIAHEDDPYRASLAAIEMINDLRPYQNQIRDRLIQAGLKPDPTDFEVRIGINTGLVVVGRVGSGQSAEYTAMGDAVNLAARMEQTAEPGTIQITQDTYRHVADLINTKPLGRVTVKGKSEPLLTYQVLGPNEDFVRLRGAAGLDAPLIGREDEMAVLHEILNQLQYGNGQICCLIGEAGLGKSRLVHEFKGEVLKLPSVRLYDVYSLSFESNQPYGLLLRALRRLCSCTQNDSLEKVKNGIFRFVQELPGELQARMLSVLISIFSITMDNDQQPLQGEELKIELFAVMSEFWQYQARQNPFILIFEDLHWADAASVELVRHLLAIVEHEQIFFLCVFRPGQQTPAWSIKQLAESEYLQRYQELVLKPLNADESDALVEGLLQAKELPGEIKDLILKKAEGNPFFAEEIVRELIESETIIPLEDRRGWRLAGNIKKLDIPDSLEAVLVARMDRLPEDTRHTMQLAAVIGRSFYYRVLESIAGNIDHLDQHLRNLQRTGLIQEVATIPEPEYLFRHVLTQEAAYNTILLKQRRYYHQRTGEIMEQLFADRLDEHAPLLANHFLLAGDWERSLKYLLQTGENAARLHANAEAIDRFSEAISLGDEAQLPVDTKIKLHRGRGLSYETIGSFEQALSDFGVVLACARDTGRKRDLWRVYLDLGKLWASRNYQESEKYYQKALEIARQLGDPVALGRSLNSLGNWYVNAERPQEGIRYHQEAWSIFDSLGDRRGQAETLDLLGMASLLGGDSVALQAYYTEAIALFEALDEHKGLISSLTAAGGSAPLYATRSVFSTSTLQDAAIDVKKALQLSRKIGWRAGESFACWQLIQIYGSMGWFGKAFAAAKDAVAIAGEIDHVQWMAGANNAWGFLYIDLLDGEMAKEKNELALQHARQVDSQYFINISTGPLVQAHILLGDLKQARDCLNLVISPDTPMITQGQRSMWIAWVELALAEGDTFLALRIVDDLIAAISIPAGGVISSLWHLRARIMLANGEFAKAESLLLPGIKNARHFGEKTLLWRLYATLGQIYQKQGRKAEASEALLRAQEILDEVTTTLPNKEMQVQFSQRAKALLNS